MESEKVVMKYTFYTTLNIEECKEKLNKNLGNPYTARGNLVGRVEANSFWAVKLDNYNSILLNRVFYGNFEEQDRVTLIKGRWRYISLTRVAAKFYLCLFVINTLIDIFKLIGKITGIISSVNYSNDLGTYVVNIIAFTVIFTIFRLASGDQEYDVKQDLKRILEVFKEEKEK